MIIYVKENVSSFHELYFWSYNKIYFFLLKIKFNIYTQENIQEVNMITLLTRHDDIWEESIYWYYFQLVGILDD